MALPNPLSRPTKATEGRFKALLGVVLVATSAELENIRRGVARVVNSAMCFSYWEIGRRIVELELAGQTRS